MSFPTEHSAEQIAPGLLESYRRSYPASWPSGVSALTGKRKGADEPRAKEIQSVRFDSGTWTVSRAQGWLRKKKMKSAVVPASGATLSTEDESEPEPGRPWDLIREGASSAPSPPSGFSAAAREEMRASMAVYRTQISSFAVDVRGGSITAAAARSRAEALLRRSYETAYRQGMSAFGVTRFGVFDTAYVEAAVKREMKFMSKFIDDMISGSGTVPYGVRAGQYVRSYETMYHVGEVQALPWESDIYWKLGSTDHCTDCVSLSEAGPYSKATLPMVPGGGATLCLTNCDCRLEFKLRRPRTKALETRPGRQSAIQSSGGTVPEGRRLPTPEELEEIRVLWGAVQEHRTAVRFGDAASKGAHASSRREANDALIEYLDGRLIHWTRSMEDTLFNPPPGGGVGGGFPAGGRAGIESAGAPSLGSAGSSVVSPGAASEEIPGLGAPGDG